jgi:DNA-binding cell septation regulator SpoVG
MDYYRSMSNNKKMTDQEIDDLVKKTMDEVMASITPALEAKYDKYKEKKAKDKAESDKAEAELDAADKAEDPEVQ